MFTSFNVPCRIPSPYLIRRNVFCYYTSCTYYCSLANSYRITNDNIYTYEHIIFNMNFTDTKHSS